MPTAKQLQSRYRRKEITKKIIKGVAISGVICIASTSPYFVMDVLKNIRKFGFQKMPKKDRMTASSIFSYLKRNGYIKIEERNKQLFVSLTEEGKKRAKQYQVDDLEIAMPKKWDKKWRIILFDIPEKSRVKREVLRGKLIELGFSKLQKSAWVHPYPCHEELKLLQSFFGLSSDDYIYFETEKLNKDLTSIKQRYNLT